MALEEKIEAVKKVSKALDSKAVDTTDYLERVQPNKEHFETLMNPQQNPATTPQVKDPNALTINATTEQTNQQSLMDEVKKLNSKVNQVSELTPEDLKNQARQLVAQIETVKTQLHAGESIKPSYQTLLRHHLTHVDESLKIALSKTGSEFTPPPEAAPKINPANPLERFLSYLTHGQYQLEHLSQTIDELGLTKKELTPTNMLAIQMKMAQVQQEIELFTNLLNKALESTKTLMNVQV